MPSIRHFHLVLSAEACMWQNVGEPLTVDRICNLLNCRRRTLTYAFKEVFGVGPMAHFKTCRLNAVYFRLHSLGKHNATRIYDLAAEFGFWHQGHFCADYKAMFGETPSQTLETLQNGQRTAHR